MNLGLLEANVNIEDFKLDYLKMYFISPEITSYETETEPRCATFINFARQDLKDCRESRGIYNAVSNSKRALHRRVDTLCNSLGYSLYKHARNNFPSKIEYLSKCGVITPQILHKLNTIRNKVEHDYEIIEYSEAENYIDIIELFLVATSIFLKNYPDSMYGDLINFEEFTQKHFYKNLPQEIVFEMNLKAGELSLKTYGKQLEQRKFIISDDAYFEWVYYLMFNYFGNY